MIKIKLQYTIVRKIGYVQQVLITPKHMLSGQQGKLLIKIILRAIVFLQMKMTIYTFGIDI